MTGTVLVVDDEVDVQLTLRIVLETAGYRVTEAASAELALMILDTSTPDLIVLDLVLPGMDGWEFLRHLRERGLERLPVVVVSATGDPGQKAIADEAGCQAFFAKPFGAEALRTAVAEILGT